MYVWGLYPDVCIGLMEVKHDPSPSRTRVPWLVGGMPLEGPHRARVTGVIPQLYADIARKGPVYVYIYIRIYTYTNRFLS